MIARRVDESTGQRPFPRIRLAYSSRTLHKQRRQLVFPDRKDHKVYRCKWLFKFNDLRFGLHFLSLHARCLDILAYLVGIYHLFIVSIPLTRGEEHAGSQVHQVQSHDSSDRLSRWPHCPSGCRLAIFYYAPTTSLVAVPIQSREIPFIFEKVTRDFQTVTIQGQLSYRIADPERTAKSLNFTLRAGGKGYESDDPEKLHERVVAVAQVVVQRLIHESPLTEAIRSAGSFAARVLQELRESRIQNRNARVRLRRTDLRRGTPICPA